MVPGFLDIHIVGRHAGVGVRVSPGWPRVRMPLSVDLRVALAVGLLILMPPFSLSQHAE